MKTSSIDLVCRLMALMEQTTEGRIIVPRECVGPDSIRRTGIDSVNLLNFLIAVEDDFGIEWDDDLPEETLFSFEALADYIGRQLSPVA